MSPRASKISIQRLNQGTSVTKSIQDVIHMEEWIHVFASYRVQVSVVNTKPETFHPFWLTEGCTVPCFFMSSIIWDTFSRLTEGVLYGFCLIGVWSPVSIKSQYISTTQFRISTTQFRITNIVYMFLFVPYNAL